ncbi:MAG: DUF58 domain-containing protein [Lentisphaeria bacterium]|nr:DUF58 domain-containing protein [Lentisphaeria bacterium]
MLPPELAREIRKLEIRTDRVVDELIGGAYHSVFKGRGIEFEEVREYAEGDDVRDIDWNVSARMNTPYIKKYIEERELNVLLMVDVSASGSVGTGRRTKRQTAAELAALLAFSAGRNGDKVGLLLFSDRRELMLAPRSGRTHTLRLIRDLLAFQPQGHGTDLAGAVAEADRLLNKRCVIFLISDFIEGGDYAAGLRVLNRRHDVIAVRIRDRSELAWETMLGTGVCDAETGEVIQLSGSAAERRAFAEAAAAELRRSEAICEAAKVDLIDLRCGDDLLRPLIRFFERRKGRIRRI